MTDEQFQKMYAVELAKLAALQGIMTLVQSIAMKQGASGASYNWKDISKMIASATAIAAETPPAPAPEKQG